MFYCIVTSHDPDVARDSALWDTWGFNDLEYKGNELEMITQGLLPSGWEMSGDFEEHDRYYDGTPSARNDTLI